MGDSPREDTSLGSIGLGSHLDYVGFGSDFDGVGDSLPTGLKDAAAYPNLIRVLLERGYSEADIRKIAAQNVLRVWNQADRYAARRAAPVAAPSLTPAEEQ